MTGYAMGLKDCYKKQNLMENISSCKKQFDSAIQFNNELPIPKETKNLCR